MKNIIFIKKNILENFFEKITKTLKLKYQDRKFLSKSLIGASLRGVDSHGIRLLPSYVQLIEEGSIKRRPNMVFKLKMPSVGILDADNGLGHSAAYLASSKAIKLAKKNGVGIVGVINSSHYGAAGAYSLEIAEKKFIGFSFTHSDAIAIPYNGYKKFHGTNPYSFSAPLLNKKPLLVDFSTTSIPWNKVLRARNNNNKIFDDVALDKYGNVTNDANLADTLIPLGGEVFGHKGFGLSSSIEVMCGPLLGMVNGLRLLPMMGPDFSYRKLGHFIMAINISSMITKKQYYNNMKNYIDDLHNQKTKNKKLFYPGEIEWKEEEKRLAKGIPFDLELRNSFLEISKKYNVSLFDNL